MKPFQFSYAAALLAALAARGHAQSRSIAFVSNEGSHDVSVVDLEAGRAVASIPLPGRARGIHLSPDNKRLYVATSDDNPRPASKANAIVVVDVASEGSEQAFTFVGQPKSAVPDIPVAELGGRAS